MTVQEPRSGKSGTHGSGKVLDSQHLVGILKTVRMDAGHRDGGRRLVPGFPQEGIFCVIIG